MKLEVRGFVQAFNEFNLAWYFSETYLTYNTTIMKKMTCKGYLQTGTKLGNIVNRLLQVVTLPPFAIFGSHTCAYIQAKISETHCTTDQKGRGLPPKHQGEASWGIPP